MGIKVGDITIKGKHKYTVKDINPETGKISWSVEENPSLETSFKLFNDLIQDLKNIVPQLNDDKLNTIYEEIKLNFNKFRTHIRKTHPKQYQNMVKEVSTSSGAGGHLSKYAFRLPKDYKKVDEGVGSTLGLGPKASKSGVKNNVYVKNFKYKLVNRKKLTNKAQTTDYKDLWGKTYK